MPRRSFSPRDDILIADVTAPRGSWIKSDSKGLVHSVRVQTKTSILERPITKICLLMEATDWDYNYSFFLVSFYLFPFQVEGKKK